MLSDGRFNYQYDANGNLIQKTEIATGNVTLYSYDFRNRLVEVQERSPGGIILSDLSYTYDVFDRRIAVERNGEKMVTVFDRQMAWAEYDASGNVLTRYLAGTKLNQWIARWQPGAGTEWFLTDRLGSVRDIINGAGQLIDHIDYASFGGIAFQSNASVSGRFLFTGLAYDTTTGLYNSTSARQFDPTMMRFISQDTIGYRSGDLNLYRYVYSNPVTLSDPTGEGVIGDAIASVVRFIRVWFRYVRFAAYSIGGPLGVKTVAWLACSNLLGWPTASVFLIAAPPPAKLPNAIAAGYISTIACGFWALTL